MQDLHKKYRQGNIYFLRNGSPGDCYKAISCLHGPACAHYVEAQYKLAFSYERLHKQINALHWYIKGAAHGDLGGGELRRRDPLGAGHGGELPHRVQDPRRRHPA